MSESIFWDKNISLNKIKRILKNSSDERFIDLAALLLSRENRPKVVFSEYIKIIEFCKNWKQIKKRMRQNKWTEKRIDFWDEVYKVAMDNIDKEKVRIRKPQKEAVDAEMQEICNKIKQARKSRGWTQKEASRQIGLSQQTISLVERGRANFSFKTIKKIANALGLMVILKSAEQKGDEADFKYLD